jgi:hypothetical protein
MNGKQREIGVDGWEERKRAKTARKHNRSRKITHAIEKAT